MKSSKLIVFLMMVFSFSISNAFSQTVIEDGTYQINFTFDKTLMLMGAVGNPNQNGCALGMLPLDSIANPKNAWIIKKKEIGAGNMAVYTIINSLNGKALDADGIYPTAVEQKLQLWDLHGGPNQKWYISGTTNNGKTTYSFSKFSKTSANIYPDKNCIGVNGCKFFVHNPDKVKGIAGVNGYVFSLIKLSSSTNLNDYPKPTPKPVPVPVPPNNQLNLYGYYKIVLSCSGKLLGIDPSCDNKNGCNAMLDSSYLVYNSSNFIEKNNNPKWFLTPVPNELNVFKISRNNNPSSYSLDGDGNFNGGKVQGWEGISSSPNQKWTIERVGYAKNDYTRPIYVIKHSNGKVLDADYDKRFRRGCKIQLWDKNAGEAQVWELISTTQ